MLSRKIITTEDGSSTIFIPEWNESYHSKHGSVQEAYHVFILNGLDLVNETSSINILEIGFGTGLNALITFLEAQNKNRSIQYTGLEKYPVTSEETQLLNYPEIILNFRKEFDLKLVENTYLDLMNVDWEKEVKVGDKFLLQKYQVDFMEFKYPENHFDLIYFDAFGARVQPELWTETLFEKMHFTLKPNGVLSTYSSKGSVRRAMQSLGFKVEKRPGPPGKREMLVATK